MPPHTSTFSLAISRCRQFVEEGVVLFVQENHLMPLLYAVVACALAGIAVFSIGTVLLRDVSPHFPDNRPLKLMIFADLHYGEAQDTLWGPEQDRKSSLVMETLLDLERPDFVVFLGDLVTGEDLVSSKNASMYLEQMLHPVVQRHLPFASTYGNHDVSINLPRERIFSVERKYPTCHTGRSLPGSMPGVTNYMVTFRSSDPKQQAPACQFVFLDSNGITGLVNKTGVQDVNWVTLPQLSVLREAIDSGVPTYVFVHIPPPQFKGFNREFSGCVGLQDEEEIDVQGEDAGLWEVMILAPNVVAVFSGHDHGSGWCCPSARRPQFSACFARHTGYGGYGNWTRGARVINIDETDALKLNTWVTLETGVRTDAFPQDLR